MSILVCPMCGYSVASRYAPGTRQHCPRCSSRTPGTWSVKLRERAVAKSAGRRREVPIVTRPAPLRGS